jgi:transporter family protein
VKPYMLFAALAGLCWGAGGYFEKAGLRKLGLPPIAGITVRTAVALVLLGLLSIPAWKAALRPGQGKGWLMVVVGGGIVAGTLGMWSFYEALAVSENLGVTLAMAFALSPLAGTAIGLLRGDQPMDLRTALGLIAVVAGIVILQGAHRAPAH